MPGICPAAPRRWIKYLTCGSADSLYKTHPLFFVNTESCPLTSFSSLMPSTSSITLMKCWQRREWSTAWVGRALCCQCLHSDRDSSLEGGPGFLKRLSTWAQPWRNIIKTYPWWRSQQGWWERGGTWGGRSLGRDRKWESVRIGWASSSDSFMVDAQIEYSVLLRNPSEVELPCRTKRYMFTNIHTRIYFLEFLLCRSPPGMSTHWGSAGGWGKAGPRSASAAPRQIAGCPPRGRTARR